jgi:hypothetical protein
LGPRHEDGDENTKEDGERKDFKPDEAEKKAENDHLEKIRTMVMILNITMRVLERRSGKMIVLDGVA